MLGNGCVGSEFRDLMCEDRESGMSRRDIIFPGNNTTCIDYPVLQHGANRETNHPRALAQEKQSIQKVGLKSWTASPLQAPD
jgi:hypothetical protein